MIHVRGWRLGVSLLVAIGCGAPKAEEGRHPDSPPPTSEQQRNSFGDVETVAVDALGHGRTRDEALRDAVLRAVEQVHGRAISLTTVQQHVASVAGERSSVQGGVRASEAISMRATLGGSGLFEATRGLVTEIHVLEENESSDGWDAHIAAKVAKYTPSDGSTPTVVVGTPRGGSVTAIDAELIRERIATAITESGTLAVLDRSGDADLAAELVLAVSGEAAATEALKRGQADVADFVVQLTVDELRVDRRTRHMRTTDRELVRYAGGASATYKIVHIASRRVLASGQASAERQSEESLRDDVDSDAWRSELLEEVARKLSSGIVNQLVRTDRVRDNSTSGR